MFDKTCIFCKIISREIPSTIVLENDTVLVIKDIAPKAPVHYLIIPKHHIQSVDSLTQETLIFGKHLFDAAHTLGNQIENKAFNLIVNNGKEAGQAVFHLHMHFLAGRNIYDSWLSL